MNTTYKITYSDIQGKEQTHLPIDWSTNFKSFKRASAQAKRLHKQNRNVTITESNKEGFVACWELMAGLDSVIFSEE